jgi:hypothetical protein
MSAWLQLARDFCGLGRVRFEFWVLRFEFCVVASFVAEATRLRKTQNSKRKTQNLPASRRQNDGRGQQVALGERTTLEVQIGIALEAALVLTQETHRLVWLEAI